MTENYYIDLTTVTLAEYEKELAEAELLPSRKIIQEDLKQRFSCLKAHGVQNLNDLLAVLKTPDRIKDFAGKTGLPEEYLSILKREVASIRPKPVNIKDFQGIAAAVVGKIEGLGIRNTEQLFDFVKTKAAREDLREKIGFSNEEILELTKLTDVVRIKWVGANFARLLVDSPCDTVEKVSNADYRELYDILMKINEEKQYFKGKFGLNDMKLCVIAAKSVPKAIKY